MTKPRSPRPDSRSGSIEDESRLWPGRADVPPHAVPRGDEPDLAASTVPTHLAPVVDAATAASVHAGVKHVAAAWVARPTGSGALLVMLSARPGLPASVAALDEAAEAIRRQAPAEPVRVVMTSVLGVARAISFSKAGLPHRARTGRHHGRTGFNVLLAVLSVLLGAIVLTVPYMAGWHGVAAVAMYVVGGLIVFLGVGSALIDAVARRGEAGGPPAGKG